ncbi:hypothetical protein [Jhaorihella thermophila]|uniref:Uncharacterized protein n=1 Tax=Jhaorihella thermophila TaxID=488547 RepID=A0A1H5XWU3_9RHOB|nr:hypothetical protein [Jhaorihella thermophila]SEG16259.1 hypothetical protein SAMN05421751_11337 [Jhaorihella thermophila]
MTTGPIEDTRAAPPVFLERQSYRRRRLLDAARLLPIMGAALFAVPLLWPRASAVGDGVPTSSAILYIFSVWAGLIVVNAAFGRLTRGMNQPSDRPDGTDRDGDA